MQFCSRIRSRREGDRRQARGMSTATISPNMPTKEMGRATNEGRVTLDGSGLAE
jgi:hypothetical protein